ncbi:MAG: DUF6279 family lipoprotein [Pseudomonadales bacterium]
MSRGFAVLHRVVVLAAVLLLSAGCSIKMLYNNADRFARWAANDYLQMDAAQEAYFTNEVKALHYWHRTEELPLYADYLDALPGNLENGVDEAEVQDIFDTFYSWWEVLEAKAMPFVTQMMMSLSDEQVARLPERFEKDNREFAEDELDRPLEEIQAEWMKQYADTMSRFSGRLTSEQKRYLELQSVRYVPQFELWAEYRQRWQRDLLKLLTDERHDPAAFPEAFRRLATSREAYYGEELTAVFDRNEALATEVTAWLLNNLTDQQRVRFSERLSEMATTFRELAAEVPADVPVGGGCLVCPAAPDAGDIEAGVGES